MKAEESLDLPLEVNISGASVLREREAGALLKLEGLLEDRVDVLPQPWS